jgi:undecaprenyl-diphosphatase
MRFGNYYRMINALEALDQRFLLFVNGRHSDFLDVFMWFVSGPWLVLLLLPFIFYFIFRAHNKAQLLWVLIGVILTVVLTDQLSVHAFKEVFQRYRPSHNLLLMEKLHLHQYDDGSIYRGGKYGFVSSHAANYFGLLTIFWSLISIKWVKFLLLSITLLVVYSRMYLGVHYFSDIICGCLLGFTLAQIVLHFLLLRKVRRI